MTVQAAGWRLACSRQRTFGNGEAKNVVDAQGRKIGELEAVYVDTAAVGIVAKGLLYLLIMGVVVFLGALVLGALRMRRPDRR